MTARQLPATTYRRKSFVELDFSKRQTQLAKFSTDLGHGKDPSDFFMIGSNHKAVWFHVAAHKRLGAYSCHTLPICHVQISLLII